MLPCTPIGRPATSTTRLPGLALPFVAAIRSPTSKNSSTVWTSGIINGVTPQNSVRRRWTLRLGVRAKTGGIGRYFETLPAELPDSVNATISAAPSCCAVWMRRSLSHRLFGTEAGLASPR